MKGKRHVPYTSVADLTFFRIIKQRGCCVYVFERLCMTAVAVRLRTQVTECLAVDNTGMKPDKPVELDTAGDAYIGVETRVSDK
jgi:hypothetical protein